MDTKLLVPSLEFLRALYSAYIPHLKFGHVVLVLIAPVKLIPLMRAPFQQLLRNSVPQLTVLFVSPVFDTSKCVL